MPTRLALFESSCKGWHRRVPCVALLLAAAPVILACPPLIPLPAPLYSLDANSPTVQGGLIAPADILAPCPNVPLLTELDPRYRGGRLL